MWIKFIDDRFELYEMALICSSEFTDFESSIRVIDLGILSSMCIYHSFQNTRKNILTDKNRSSNNLYCRSLRIT